MDQHCGRRALSNRRIVIFFGRNRQKENMKDVNTLYQKALKKNCGQSKQVHSKNFENSSRKQEHFSKLDCVAKCGSYQFVVMYENSTRPWLFES